MTHTIFHVDSKYDLEINQLPCDCDQCDANFTQQTNLNNHKKSKHEGIIYDCDQCNASFTH